MSTREQYVEKHQAEIDKWNAEIEDLEAKIKAASIEELFPRHAGEKKAQS